MLNPLAIALGTNPLSSTTFMTFSRVFGFTRLLLLITLDTVAVDTPAFRATSLIFI